MPASGNIAEYLIGSTQRDDDIAIITSQGSFTFGQLKRGVARIGELLREHKLEKGDRVIICGKSSFFWTCAYLGVAMIGGVSVPLPDNIKIEKLKWILKYTTPKYAMLGSSSASFMREISGDICVFREDAAISEGEVAVSPDDLINGKCEFSPVVMNAEEDLAALMFTSGSTSEPVGVMITHENIFSNTQSIIEALSLTGKDRIAAVLPFYYCFGTSLLHTHLAVGGSVMVENSFLFPEKVLDRIEETECTGIAGVPSTYQILLSRSTFCKREMPSLRYVQQAGGKLPDRFISELKRCLPGKQIYIMYGQTEATARLSVLDPALLGSKLGSVGKGMPGVKLEVLDDDGNKVAPGDEGEIVASGKNIAKGYWNDQAATRNSFKGGKLYTGDRATIDGDGFLYVVGRNKEFIKCAGHRISSKEIEKMALECEGVVEAVALSIEDESLGEAICLVVSHLKGSEAHVEISEFCRNKYSWPFVPKRIIVLSDIPKTISGKPDRIRLKTILEDVEEGSGK